MLNVKKLITKMIQGDFVVEQGTQNGWGYRKWNSGRCEAWRDTASLGTLTPTIWVSPIRYADTTISLPSLFNAEPGVLVTSQSNQWWVVRGDAQSTEIAIRLGTVSSSAQAAYVDIYLFGRWK